jgi:hypothetical protein
MDSGGTGRQQRAKELMQVAHAVDHHAGGSAGVRGLEGTRLRRLTLVQAPMHRAGDLRERELAFAEAEVERVEGGQPEFGEDLGQGRRAHAEAVELALEHLASLLAVLAFVELAEEAPHLGAVARPRRGSRARHQPVAARVRLLRRDDLDRVAVRELVVERHHAAVDARPAAAVPEAGVHVIGEVERRGAAGQIHDLAARAQSVDAILEDLGLQAVEQVGLGGPSRWARAAGAAS